jgi:alpha-glucosidase
MARQPAKRQAILVGIDNAERNRIREYSPTIRGHRLGRGDVKSQGHAYLEFIEQSLKPFIDETYRTKPDREFTGIVGSSMGGLIAFYAGLRFSHVFGKVGVLSPSLWHDSKWHEWAASPSQPLSQMYVCASRTEMSSMAKTMQEVYWGLKNGGFSDEQIRVVLRNRGTHSEAFWAREFKPMYEWLFP